jgi:hypothetical protein
MSTASPQKLYQAVQDTLRRRHYSYRTEQRYLDVLRDYVRFHERKNPLRLGVPEIRDYLTLPSSATSPPPPRTSPSTPFSSAIAKC